jgi:hypothetical protein
MTVTLVKPMYHIRFPDGTNYTDHAHTAWPWHVAKIIARNVAMKRQVVTTLVVVEEVITEESSYDRISHLTKGCDH